jgi:site-specific recombinase XerD
MRSTTFRSNQVAGNSILYSGIPNDHGSWMSTQNMDIQLLAHKFYDYSTYIRGYSKETIRRYRSVINYYSKTVGITRIEQVTEENLRNFFFFGRTQRNWKPNTYIVFHKSLVVFFRWCIEQGHMEKNPMDIVEIPKLEKRLPASLSKEDALKLLEVIYNYPFENTFTRCRNHAIFSTFIFAGLRRSEVLNLKYMDVDLEGKSIFIRQGKGQKDRVVPIALPLVQSLSRYLEQRRKLCKTATQFFVSSNRDVGFTDQGLKHVVSKIKKSSKLNFTVHKLRHTFATLLIEGGCDIYSLSRMMGHSDIRTTTVYLSASAEHLRSQITKHALNEMAEHSFR